MPDETEDQPADKLVPLSGELGIFHPDGVFKVQDAAFRLGVGDRTAREFVRDCVPNYTLSKGVILFVGRDFNAAVARLIAGPQAKADGCGV